MMSISQAALYVHVLNTHAPKHTVITLKVSPGRIYLLTTQPLNASTCYSDSAALPKYIHELSLSSLVHTDGKFATFATLNALVRSLLLVYTLILLKYLYSVKTC